MENGVTLKPLPRISNSIVYVPPKLFALAKGLGYDVSGYAPTPMIPVDNSTPNWTRRFG